MHNLCVAHLVEFFFPVILTMNMRNVFLNRTITSWCSAVLDKKESVAVTKCCFFVPLLIFFLRTGNDCE